MRDIESESPLDPLDTCKAQEIVLSFVPKRRLYSGRASGFVREAADQDQLSSMIGSVVTSAQTVARE